jgi:hypothetical protein
MSIEIKQKKELEIDKYYKNLTPAAGISSSRVTVNSGNEALPSFC